MIKIHTKLIQNVIIHNKSILQAVFTFFFFTQILIFQNSVSHKIKYILLSSHEEYQFCYMSVRQKQYKLKCGQSVDQEGQH